MPRALVSTRNAAPDQPHSDLFQLSLSTLGFSVVLVSAVKDDIAFPKMLL
jgi:hypothetical protein